MRSPRAWRVVAVVCTRGVWYRSVGAAVSRRTGARWPFGRPLKCLISWRLFGLRAGTQVATQSVDFDSNSALGVPGGGAVLGSTPGAPQVRAEGCCPANGSV